MITTSFTDEQAERLRRARATVDDVSQIVNRTYKRNGDGEFSSGGGGATEPTMIATARGGGHSVAKFDDPDGTHLGTTLEPAQYVAIDSGSQFGARKGLADAEFVMLAEHARGVADAMDSVAAKSRTIAAPTDPRAFDNGPSVVATEHVGPYHVTTFHDGNGDMVDEGGRFVQITDRTDFHDSLNGGTGSQLTVDASDVAGVAGAIRKVGGGSPSNVIESRLRWARTAVNRTYKRNADGEFSSGGGGDGGGSVSEHLHAVGGTTEGTVYSDEGGYADWSVKHKDGSRTMEGGDESGDAVQITVTPSEQQSLVHSLTLTVASDEGGEHSAHMATMLATHQERMDFADDGYIDWSSKHSNGDRTVEFGQGRDAVVTLMTPKNFREWQSSLALTVMGDQ